MSGLCNAPALATDREETTMKAKLLAATTAAALMAAGAAQAQPELTLCWGAWDPANALVELSKDFEAQSGIKMKFEFVPWPNFADRMLNEEGIKLLTGIVFSNVSGAVVPEALDAGAIYVSPNAAPSPLAGEKCHPNYFVVSWQNDSLHEASGAAD